MSKLQIQALKNIFPHPGQKFALVVGNEGLKQLQQAEQNGILRIEYQEIEGRKKIHRILMDTVFNLEISFTVIYTDQVKPLDGKEPYYFIEQKDECWLPDAIELPEPSYNNFLFRSSPFQLPYR